MKPWNYDKPFFADLPAPWIIPSSHGSAVAVISTVDMDSGMDVVMG